MPTANPARSNPPIADIGIISLDTPRMNAMGNMLKTSMVPLERRVNNVESEVRVAGADTFHNTARKIKNIKITAGRVSDVYLLTNPGRNQLFDVTGSSLRHSK
tara:strand:+ start:271 stop:579 length:309 start_codon:yes stop_codon:yes gene_type:complete